jgi:hypothetical protein
MALGFTGGFERAQDRRIARERNELLSRQIGVAERAQMQSQAQELVNNTLLEIQKTIAVADASGKPREPRKG